MMIKLNLNTALAFLGGIGIFAPDLTAVATWLNGMNIHWVTYVSKVVGALALFCAAAPLAVPKLRSFLSLLGLATPAGVVVLDPDKPTIESTIVIPPPTNKEAGFVKWNLLVGVVLVGALFFMVFCMAIRVAKADEPTQPPTIMPTLPELPSLTPPPATPTPVVTPPEVPKVAPIDTEFPTSTATTPTPYMDSRYGKCIGDFCLAPAFALQAFQYIPSTGEMIGGVAFAGGYGVVWHTLIDLGLAFYGGVQFARDRPFQAQGLAMISIANYVAFGPGFQMIGQESGPAKFMMTICFAANWIPGLTVNGQ